jgi:hypothetical protein
VTTHEPEITRPVDLCGADGRLADSARGWSRRPLHRSNLGGPWGRRKRWDYWAITNRDGLVLAITYADLDYLGLVTVAFLDVRAQRWTQHALVVPGALGFSQPDTVGGGDIRFALPTLRLAITETPDGTRLAARFRNLGGHRLDADVLVARPAGHETLSVVIPWSERRFQFTSKHNTRPAVGRVLLDGVEHRFGADNDGYGCLDYGRGLWPYRTVWNWAAASGRIGERVVGLQFGGKWTDGTGFTENALCIDGRLTKIGEDLDFAYDRSDYTRPWTIRAPLSGLVDLRFEPAYEKRLDIQLGAGAANAHICFGHFAGRVVTESGEAIEIPRLFGWAEEMRARW